MPFLKNKASDIPRCQDKRRVYFKVYYFQGKIGSESGKKSIVLSVLNRFHARRVRFLAGF
jgi:hypothetical protein